MLKHRDRRRDDAPRENPHAVKRSRSRHRWTTSLACAQPLLRDCAALLASGVWIAITTVASRKHKA